MTRLIIGFISWLCFIKYEVWRNYTLIEVEKERPNYLTSFGIRIFFGAVCLAIMMPDMNLEQWNGIVSTWPYVVNEVSIFYLIFDPWLNKKRGLKWNYRGKKSGIFFDRIHLIWYYAFKIHCLAGLVYSTITLLK